MALNLSLSTMSWRARLGAFALLAVLGTAAFWYSYAQPTQDDIDARRAQLDGLRAEIERGRAIALRLPQFRQEVSAFEAQLESLRAVLPEEKDVADLLRRIQGMATESNLAIRGFTPQAVAAKDLHAEWPIGLQLEGTYHDLGGFLERVSKFPRIINVNGIRIRARDNQAVGATVTAECIATTFVLVEPRRAAAPATPVPAAAPAARTE